MIVKKIVLSLLLILLSILSGCTKDEVLNQPTPTCGGFDFQGRRFFLL